ncbi:glycosyltransferase family 2 protein [Qipengyuania sp. S6317L1]|uniref:glycosyltransferase family 2 protein n=1 Tax=Qipengyuania sp. S6317L1 TaxID=2926410 RepID=UPI001FF4DA9A|nr:glycosyltransferase family 2 protein [Qipengyuania sp. S6317L1]MCK0098213.1 glycosyltransferase family 2 protein [Qipengyuania sp. S6317L1]
MTVAVPLPFDDSDWQLPSHEEAIYAPKAHRYALVIPVINEGQRIRGQLSRIKEAQLRVDVIVADGGSTDGSLDADFVKPVGVRAVLTKTGPGKLSAQLRMAYAWALREGYEGIVTIDGNGKDGVEAVTQFVAKLEEGCDYVQGSRYLPGGEAENTPLERTIANRLIHAPLLSLAGKHGFTDTTNGFRAYSARYLTHPDVAPFRAEFEVYNLLFYLTVRAGQLALKVDHVPVVRRYPQDGKVPTKIGGLASKLALLGETVRAATGGYTPDHAARPNPSFLWPAIFAAAVLLPLFLSVVVAPDYSPDSWALYELGKTVFGDFYRFTHFRSYASASEYSAAFAPLWPSLIAIVDAALGTGARTGLYLAFVAYFAFVLVSEQIGRRVTGAPWVGTAAALIPLLGPSMVWDELGAGRTIPLQMLLYALILRGALAGRGMTVAGAGLIGLLAGLAVMNRFDAALLPVLAAMLVRWFTRSPARVIAALAASAVAVSPWVAYSLGTFGTVFATDNAGIATALDPRAFVTDWWPQAQPSLADDPGAWALKVMGGAGQWAVNAIAILAGPLGAAWAFGLLGLGGVHWLGQKAPSVEARAIGFSGRHDILFAFTAMIALLMVPQIVTGYLEYRYYSALVWAFVLLPSTWLISQAVSMAQARSYATILSALILPWLALFAWVTLFAASQDGRVDLEKWSDFESPRDVAVLQDCLEDEPGARILVMEDDLFAAKAGALGSLRTMMEPRNIAEQRAGAPSHDAFIEAWDVDYLLLRDPWRIGDAEAIRGAALKNACPLLLFNVAGDR